MKRIFFIVVSIVFANTADGPIFAHYNGTEQSQELALTSDDNTDLSKTIQTLLSKKKYCKEEWEKRFVNPSSQDVIDKMRAVTNEFLIELDQADILSIADKDQRTETVVRLIDEIPWSDFDTAERDFIFEEISPILIKLEIDLFRLLY